MSGVAATLVRIGVAVLIAAVVLVLPGHLPGTGTGVGLGRGMGSGTGIGAVPVAEAGDEWSDGDPIRLVQAADGRLLPVAIFYMPGAQVRSLLDLPRIILLLRGTLLHVQSTSEPVDGGTKVSLRVTVPSGLGEPFPTRLMVSRGPLGTLTRYSEVYGMSGQPMVAEFILPNS